jgi:hypothetical protein
MITQRFRHLSITVAIHVLAGIAHAEDDAAELAKKLSNPVANLISVPFQFNWDFKLGPLDEGNLFKLRCTMARHTRNNAANPCSHP